MDRQPQCERVGRGGASVSPVKRETERSQLTARGRDTAVKGRTMAGDCLTTAWCTCTRRRIYIIHEKAILRDTCTNMQQAVICSIDVRHAHTPSLRPLQYMSTPQALDWFVTEQQQLDSTCNIADF